MSTRDTTPDAPEQLDQVLLTVINNSFVNVCREMGITMARTAFSPIFNEGLDFSCVLFDRELNMIGQAEFCPRSWRPASSSSAGRSRSWGSTASSPVTSSSTTTRTAAAPTSPSTR